VVAVGGPDLGGLVGAVVRLVGQAQAALHDVGHVPLGVAAVGRDVQADDARHAGALQVAQHLDEGGHVGDAVDAVQVVLQRLGAERVDAVGVHEAGVELADLALVGVEVGGRVVECVAAGLDDAAHDPLGLVDQRHERAGRGAVGLDGRVAQPGSVHVPEEVVLRAGRGIERRGVDGRTSRRGGGLGGRGAGIGHLDRLPACPCRTPPI
jgi:hypothetical protein